LFCPVKQFRSDDFPTLLRPLKVYGDYEACTKGATAIGTYERYLRDGVYGYAVQALERAHEVEQFGGFQTELPAVDDVLSQYVLLRENLRGNRFLHPIG